MALPLFPAMPLNAELLASCLAPITADAPAGSALAYDPRLDLIKEARREEILPGADPKYADWPTVVAQCSALLQKETKNLQLSGWLTEGLLRRQGIPGLLTGIAITRGLVEQYWDTLHPVITDEDDRDVRLGHLEWIGSKLTLPLRLAPVIGSLSCADLDAARAVPSDDEARGDAAKKTEREKAIAAGRVTPEDVSAQEEGLTKTALRAQLADVDAAVAELAALETLCDGHFDGEGPSFSGLRTALDEPRRHLAVLLARKLEADPDPVEETSGEGEAAEEEARAADASDADGAISPEPTSLADAGRRIGVVARWLRQQQRTDPTPYRLLRGYRWGELLALAPTINDRLLEAPPTALRSKLRSLFLDAKWTELLEQGEALMATPAGRGWLDLQRYVYTAAVNLGAEYAPVAFAIRAELRTLLATFPTLPRLTLMDETPTANDETREWIAEEIVADAPAAATPEGAADTIPSDGSELVAAALASDHLTAEQGGLAKVRTRHPAATQADPFAQALAEQRAGRPQRAIELLTTELQRERSPRGRFLRQTQIAFIMVEAGMNGIAMPILQQLLERIDEKKLEDWESGPLVAQPLALMYRVLVARNENTAEQEKLYLRICRLDPIQALGLRS